MWRIGLFALLGVGCGIFANGIRVVSIVMLDWSQGARVELSSHVSFQWVAFAFAIAVMVAVLMWLAPEPEERTHGAQTCRRARAGGRSLVAALCATVLAVAIPQIVLAHIARQNQRVDRNWRQQLLRNARGLDKARRRGRMEPGAAYADTTPLARYARATRIEVLSRRPGARPIRSPDTRSTLSAQGSGSKQSTAHYRIAYSQGAARCTRSS